MVEFAIVAPVFFVLVFGMIEFGRMVMVQQVLTNASREGARVGVIDGTTTTDVTNKVAEYLNAASITGQTVAVQTLPAQSAESGEQVQVSVSIPFNQVSWIPAPFFLGNKTLEATTVMRKETVQ